MVKTTQLNGKNVRFYENLEFLQDNRMPQRAYYIPENKGAYTLLNGEWNFKYFDADFKEKGEITSWDKNIGNMSERA